MIKDINKIKVIAEIGQAHEGSLAIALSYVEAVAKAGADAVKFQTHFANAESSNEDRFRKKNQYIKDKSRYDYWKRTEFTLEQWKIIKKFAEKNKLVFMSSPFSIKAAKDLNEIKIKAWKIGSGEINNYPMLEYIAKTKKPIFLSTGLSNYKEISDSIKFLKKYNSKIILMQCTSLYPCPKNKVGLNVINEFINRFKLKVGYSDHSGKIEILMAAYSLGAKVLETHVTFSKQIKLFDNSSSIEISKLKKLCQYIKNIDEVIKNPVNKNIQDEVIKRNKFLFGKSIVINKNLKKNDLIREVDLDYKKPLIGINAKYYKKIIGKKLKKNIQSGTFLKLSQIV